MSITEYEADYGDGYAPVNSDIVTYNGTFSEGEIVVTHNDNKVDLVIFYTSGGKKYSFGWVEFSDGRFAYVGLVRS